MGPRRLDSHVIQNLSVTFGELPMLAGLGQLVSLPIITDNGQLHFLEPEIVAPPHFARRFYGLGVTRPRQITCELDRTNHILTTQEFNRPLTRSIDCVYAFGRLSGAPRLITQKGGLLRRKPPPKMGDKDEFSKLSAKQPWLVFVQAVKSRLRR